MTTRDDHDGPEQAPGARGTGLAGPQSTGPGAGAGPGGPDPGPGEPEGDPSRAVPEDRAGSLGSPGTFLTDPTEGAGGEDVWPGGADAEDEVDDDDLPDS